MVALGCPPDFMVFFFNYVVCVMSKSTDMITESMAANQHGANDLIEKKCHEVRWVGTIQPIAGNGDRIHGQLTNMVSRSPCRDGDMVSTCYDMV